MNQKTQRMLSKIRSELATIDWNYFDDNPNYVTNYICNHCKHPIYYFHGFYQRPNWLQGEEDAKISTKEDCDYALLQCIECGDFLSLTHPKNCHLNWEDYFAKKRLKVLYLEQPFETVRNQYFEFCAFSNKSSQHFCKTIKIPIN